MIGTIPGFEPLPVVRPGVRWSFSGCAPDANGENTGEFVQVDLVIPPLSFGALRTLQDLQTHNGSNANVAQVLDYTLTAVELALRRNYRGVPRWLIEQTLDQASSAELAEKINQLSGVVSKKTEETTATSPSTGTGSSVGSSTPPDNLGIPSNPNGISNG